jgi:RsiW-degrading membrane proteinase PrsW (M82 family)
MLRAPSVFDKVLAVVGVIPPFLWLWFAERFERRVREPTLGWRYRILVATGLASFPIALAANLLSAFTTQLQEPLAGLYDSFVVAATCEEVGKFSCLWLLTRRKLAPGSRYGAFLYALHATMGFALVENVVAMFTTTSLVDFTVRFVLRAYLSVPVHLFAGGVVGYFWALRRFDHGSIGIPGGLAIAILIHGSYNAMLYAIERLPDGFDGVILSYATAACAIPLIGVAILWLAGRQLTELDRRDGRGTSQARRGG